MSSVRDHHAKAEQLLEQAAQEQDSSLICPSVATVKWLAWIGKQAVAYAVFAVIASAGVAAPVVIYFAMGKRSGCARRADGLDGPQQRGHHVGSAPAHGGQADRRCRQRAGLTAGEGAPGNHPIGMMRGPGAGHSLGPWRGGRASG